MTHGSIQPQAATWGFLLVPHFCDFVRLDFLRHRGLSSDALKPRRRVEPNASFFIGSMSPPDYSSARLRTRRAGLRFIRCAQGYKSPNPAQVFLGSNTTFLLLP